MVLFRPQLKVTQIQSVSQFGGQRFNIFITSISFKEFVENLQLKVLKVLLRLGIKVNENLSFE